MDSLAKWMLKALCISVVILYTFPVHAGDLLQDLSDLKKLINPAERKNASYSHRIYRDSNLDRVIRIASLKTGVEEEMP